MTVIQYSGLALGDCRSVFTQSVLKVASIEAPPNNQTGPGSFDLQFNLTLLYLVGD